MCTSDNDALFRSKIDDAIRLCATRQKPYYFPFMSERKQNVAAEYLKTICCENYLFFGGCGSSERKMLGIFYKNPFTSDFPISAIEFSFRASDKLTHRDFLGALMSLGIERETVGDILVENSRCVVFVKSELKDYITSQLFKIGNVGVKIKDADLSNLPRGRGREERFYTVTSLRLDNVVAAVSNYSRQKTKELILSGSVCVNYTQMQNVSHNLKANDIFTIRGMGKFILNGVLGNTKKDRLRISVFYFR